MRPNLSKSKSPAKRPADAVVKDIRLATRRHFSAEDKIRIVLDGLRGEDSIAELCRKEGIARACITPGRRSSWKPVSAA
jgi:transposase